jgi:hypothetical protein
MLSYRTPNTAGESGMIVASRLLSDQVEQP